MKTAITILKDHLDGKVRANATVNDTSKLITEAMELYAIQFKQDNIKIEKCMNCNKEFDLNLAGCICPGCFITE